MPKHLIVPIDESAASWHAFDVALELAKKCNADVRLTAVACDPVDGRFAAQRLHAELERRAPFSVNVVVDVRLTIETVATELATAVDEHPASLVVMASHGKGRSAGIVGSVAEDMLNRTHGPILLVGPHVSDVDFSGPIVASVDGSPESETALPVAAAWAIELGTAPWIVTASDASSQSTGDVLDTAYPARLARELHDLTGVTSEFEVLHDPHAQRAIPNYAESLNASVIVASSHGRSGLSRLVLGSVAAGFVRNATCPVMVVQLQPSSTTAAGDVEDISTSST